MRTVEPTHVSQRALQRWELVEGGDRLRGMARYGSGPGQGL